MDGIFSQFFEQAQQQGHSHSRSSEPVDTQHLYDVLEVPKNADARTIKRAFRQAAKKHHPDRGGDPDVFKEVNKANEILSDPEKRKIYDKHGMKGVNEGGGSSMFSRRGKKKGQGGLLTIDCTLEDLYNGATKKAKFNKQFFCDECGGTGGKNVVTCETCNGRGAVVQIRQIGPGMIQQVQAACDACQGQGERCKPRDRCRSCNGKKVYRKIHTFDVHINKGMKDKQKICKREFGDQAPGIIPGDVYCQLAMTPHPKYKREGSHLFYTKEISLVEALTGFEFVLETMDNRTLIVQSEPDVLYGPGCIRAIRDEGMPMEGNHTVKGNLYIVIQVKFPDKLDTKTLAELAKILPGAGNVEGDFSGKDDIEEVELERIDYEEHKEMWKREQESRENYKSQFDDDDDSPRGSGQGAQCQTQ